MDRTQRGGSKPPVSKAILVTLIALAASDFGFMSGIFARTVGHITPYAAAAIGASAAAAVFGIGLRVAMFVRSTSHR